MFVKFTPKGLWDAININNNLSELGIEYDCGLYHYEIIDENLFFLAVITHGLEFSEIYHESRSDYRRLNS
jgi:hypothetical protein